MDILVPANPGDKERTIRALQGMNIQNTDNATPNIV